METLPESAAKRFWAKVYTQNGCWQWLAAKDRDGYGVFTYKKRQLRAPRVAYRLSVGDIPDSMTIDHLCKQPWCVNPDHMEVVSVRENVMRSGSLGAINARKTHCKNGHKLELGNLYFPKNGQRECRRCRLDRCAREYREKRGLK